MKTMKNKSVKLFGAVIVALVAIVLSMTFLNNGSISAFASNQDQDGNGGKAQK